VDLLLGQAAHLSGCYGSGVRKGAVGVGIVAAAVAGERGKAQRSAHPIEAHIGDPGGGAAATRPHFLVGVGGGSMSLGSNPAMRHARELSN
jgi:hypothetical protein